jgi:hypothetical protein
MAEPDRDTVMEQRAEMEADFRCDALSVQCCPMDTYGTDSAGNLRPECTCSDGCECLCSGCICRTVESGWDDDDFWPERGGEPL